MKPASILLVLLLTALALPAPARGQWQPAPGPLRTRWAKDVSPENAHREYPRPQMARKDWLNLNGLWEYAIRPRDDARPASFDGQILVPFAVESALSGVMKPVSDTDRLWYRRTVEVPAAWSGQRVLLHFGAVDWEVQVWVNGKEAGGHRGGYDPFTIDITSALAASGPQEIVVGVLDPTDRGTQPRGKQVLRPNGIWYTPVTGIWQTVWLEPVPQASIARLKMVPDAAAGSLRLEVEMRGALPAGARVRAEARDDTRVVAAAAAGPGEPLLLKVPEPRLWSPDSPFLYSLRVALASGTGGEAPTVDQVESYFGLRDIRIGKDERGITRILLNKKPLFQYGPLDQGFWPDGLYTAPSDEALRFDIEVTRRLGCNLARKHVKVEPDRWYYWCDRLGLLVWQDMPSGDRHIRGDQPDLVRTPESARQFELEWQAIIESLWNHPSIVMWVPFNEGWGQFDTARIVEWTRRHDPTRLVNGASGWTDRGVGDVHDVHIYPGPGSPDPEPARAAVLGEFGGLGLPLKGHTWQDERNWGYRSFTTREALGDAYLALIENLRPLIGSPGLSAAIYTQTTDVEIEVNGLLTYDREVMKLDAERLAAAHRLLYLPPPVVEVAVPTSEREPIEWRYTLEAPPEGWQAEAFDDGAWRQGPGGFGTRGTPGAVVRTEWNTRDIWLRRSFDLPAGRNLEDLRLRLHHDEDAEVWLNGVPAASVNGYTTGYSLAAVSAVARQALRPGRNLVAIHCRQTRGGQYIDAGLAAVKEPEAR
jgi:hypothetical protein